MLPAVHSYSRLCGVGKQAGKREVMLVTHTHAQKFSEVRRGGSPVKVLAT